MPQSSFPQKNNGRSQSRSASASSEGLAVSPPSYGIHAADHQPVQAAGLGFGSKKSKLKQQNNTGLPDKLKSGIEHLSGFSMSDVKVHYHSQKPAQLNAYAYTQGTEIHVAPGQEKHLPHEAWHVVQQKQGRVSPTVQAKGMGINDNQALEHEADVMGSKAMQSAGQPAQFKKSATPHAIVQRKESSFPEDSKEKLKEMGYTQLKSKSAPIQLRGGAKAGVLSIKSSHVGSSLIAGHAWLSYMPNGGGEQTHGTWGNVDPIGYHANLEVGRGASASRSTDVDAADLGKLNTFIGANNAWGYFNNCSSFAARGWKDVTNESLAYTSLGIPNPSALGVGIVAANGGTTGVLPAGRGSSVNSVSSTSSSSVGISSNTANSAIGSTSLGGSSNASSGNTSL